MCIFFNEYGMLIGIIFENRGNFGPNRAPQQIAQLNCPVKEERIIRQKKMGWSRRDGQKIRFFLKNV